MLEHLCSATPCGLAIDLREEKAVVTGQVDLRDPRGSAKASAAESVADSAQGGEKNQRSRK